MCPKTGERSLNLHLSVSKPMAHCSWECVSPNLNGAYSQLLVLLALANSIFNNQITIQRSRFLIFYTVFWASLSLLNIVFSHNGRHLTCKTSHSVDIIAYDARFLWQNKCRFWNDYYLEQWYKVISCRGHFSRRFVIKGCVWVTLRQGR